jgi:hypothetical protein
MHCLISWTSLCGLILVNMLCRIFLVLNTIRQTLCSMMEKSRLAKHAYEEGHHIQWKEAKAVQIETNICRKYK